MQPGTVLSSAIVLSNGFGDWARVPGFEDELWVSSTGYVWQRDIRCGGWFAPSRNSPKPSTGDVFVGHRGKDLRVHKLMAMAFFGPAPSPAHTVDHLTKYDGDIIRERSDNRVENLRWASKSEQSLNRNKQQPRRDGRAVWAWQVASERSSATRYESSLAAANALGINAGSVSRTAAGPLHYQTNGYHVEFADSHEPDKIAADEVFREVDGFMVSQYGRARDHQTNAFSYTPQVNKGQQYAHVSTADGSGGSRSFTFHRLVAKAWPDVVGGKPDDGREYTVDHVNRDKADNRASNLRWKTPSEQSLNRSLPILAAQKGSVAVELLGPGWEAWQRFDSQCEAVQAVNAAFGTKLTQTTVSDSLKMAPLGRTIYKGRHKGWSIRKAR